MINTSLSKAHLLLALPLIVALQRDTRQETRYTLLNLDPIPHQLRKVFRPTLTLRDELHPRRTPSPIIEDPTILMSRTG
jgi:hypothetical protein